MQEFITTLLQAIVTVAVPVVSAATIRFLSQRSAQAKEAAEAETGARLMAEVMDAVATAVAAVSQEYVDTLKKSGTFTADNQREAFRMATDMAQSLLTTEAVKFVDYAYGGMSKFLAAKIEAEVRLQKVA